MAWNLPSRSTTQAFCCGTTRMLSMTSAMTSAMMNTMMTAGAEKFAAYASPVTTSTAISFGIISAPWSMGESGFAARDAQRAAVHGDDVEHIPSHRGAGFAFDA